MQTLSGITGYPTLIAVFAVLFGLVFGSFASVLTVRIPAGKSIVYPDSACPKCGRWLPPWENVPLLSYLLLRGRCRGCGERIGLFYPLMEIGTAALYVLAVYAGGLTPVGLAYSGFAVITLPLLIIDLRHRRLPNVLTLAGFSWAILCAVIAAVLAQDAAGLLTPVLSAAGCAAFFLLLNIVSRGGMGLGDVKLAGVIGATLGMVHWQLAAFGIMCGFLAGGISSIWLLLTRRVKFGNTIPFGPYMLLGAWLAITLGSEAAISVLRLWYL
jgi:leader peptidase (prepilin peptidase)/N-methyltransferase